MPWLLRTVLLSAVLALAPATYAAGTDPYAVAFGGQGSAWLETLEELVSGAGIESELATLVGEVELLLGDLPRIDRRGDLLGRHEYGEPPR